MQVITATEAAALVDDGWTLTTAGFVGAGHAEAVTAALEARFLTENRPRDLTVEAGAGTLRIRAEGAVRKVVPQVSHLSFNGAYVASLGIEVLYVTERAVFELQDGRLTLTEIAPGIDLQRDVLAQLDAEVRVAPQLRRMDPRIFHDRPMSEQG